MLLLNQCYTRAEIHAECKGGVRDYLPHDDGRVVCVCVTRDMNPDAPEVLLVGEGEKVQRYGEVLAGQREPLPVFLKENVHQWKYLGDYVVTGSSSAPEEIGPLARRAGREDEVTLVVYMKQVVI